MIIKDNFIDFKVLFNVLLSSKKFNINYYLFFGIAGVGLSFLVDELYLARISLYPAKKTQRQT